MMNRITPWAPLSLPSQRICPASVPNPAALVAGFSREIDILEHALERIAQVGGSALAGLIMAMRNGRLSIRPGGGGYYGKDLKAYGD